MLVYYFDHEDGGVPTKRRLIFTELHGVVYQKIELFITTAVGTSVPTKM
jgi:hypothetical protein